MGKKLLSDAITFAKECQFRSILLWSVTALDAAANLYRAAGFVKIEEKLHHCRVDVIEVKNVLELQPNYASRS